MNTKMGLLDNLVSRRSWKKGDFKIDCGEKEDGTAVCKMEEKDGNRWAWIKKVPDDKGGLKTKRVRGSDPDMVEKVKLIAKNNIRPKREQLIK